MGGREGGREGGTLDHYQDSYNYYVSGEVPAELLSYYSVYVLAGFFIMLSLSSCSLAGALSCQDQLPYTRAPILLAWPCAKLRVCISVCTLNLVWIQGMGCSEELSAHFTHCK